ncbi:MAG: hypothetical protein ABIQ06_15285 [Caldimonas sp.]
MNHRFGRAAFGLLVAFVLTACGPGYDSAPCDGCELAQAESSISVSQTGGFWRPGQTVTTRVYVNYPAQVWMQDQARYAAFVLDSVTRSGVDDPGVHTEITILTNASCIRDSVPPENRYQCVSADLKVKIAPEATYVGPIILQATLRTENPGVERPGFVDIPATPESTLTLIRRIFDVSVPPMGGKIYAPGGSRPVRIERQPGFTGEVTLTLDDHASGDIKGRFEPNPVPANVDTASLIFDIPATYAAGITFSVGVVGRSDGGETLETFQQVVSPAFTVQVTTTNGGPAVLTATRPLDLDVTIHLDPAAPYGVNGPGRIDLSLPDPPPGVSVSFLPDAQPVSGAPAGPVLFRGLRLSGPTLATMDDLRVRATAVAVVDNAGRPLYAEGRIPLSIDPAMSWEFVGSDAGYGLNTNDTIGIAIQNDGRPAIAWLFGPIGGSNAIYLKRFDGTTFAPSPPGVGAGSSLAIPGGSIDQARMAMARDDFASVAHVAFTYTVNGQEGARVGHGSAGASWTYDDELASLPASQHARSPRIAVGSRDALALSYLVETGIPATAGSLHVRTRFAAGALAELPGPHGDGSINASATGRVLRDTPSLALSAEGKPWLAWIEQASFQPAVLWLRSHNGTNWDAPIQVPTRRPVVEAATQLVVEPGGAVVVAWRESDSARLMLARLDPASGAWIELNDTVHPDGALNISADQAAREASLTLDSRGRLALTWTEGPPDYVASHRLYAKRRNEDGTWTRLGTEVDQPHPIQSPFIVGDGAGRLYVSWIGHLAGSTYDNPHATLVLVGRWNFP